MTIINILFQCKSLDTRRIQLGQEMLLELCRLSEVQWFTYQFPVTLSYVQMILILCPYIECSESLQKVMWMWCDTNGQKLWCFPKFHMLQHSFSSFQVKGVPTNMSTKPGEHNHQWQQKVFQTGNFKDTGKQVQACIYFVAFIINHILLSRSPHTMSIFMCSTQYRKLWGGKCKWMVKRMMSTSWSQGSRKWRF